MNAMTLDPLFASTDEAPRARRNLLFGIWAGQRLGLAGAALASFAEQVMDSDHQERGDGDVLRHVSHTLEASALGLPARELEQQLVACERQARRETLHHD